MDELDSRHMGHCETETVDVTEWQARSVRGILSGALKKRLKIDVVSEKKQHGCVASTWHRSRRKGPSTPGWAGRNGLQRPPRYRGGTADGVLRTAASAPGGPMTAGRPNLAPLIQRDRAAPR